MQTIAIHTSKGGVGKTTLTVNLSYELAARGYKVLVIDLDDQANSSLYLGVNRASELDNAKSIDEFNSILQSFRDRKEIIDFLEADINSIDFNYKDYIKVDSPFNQLVGRINSTGRIDVLPSSYRTKENDTLSKFAGGPIREKRLDRALRKTEIANIYDYVIIDTPPNLTTVGLNGLYAARYLIVPTQLEYFSVYGVTSIITTLKKGVQYETEEQAEGPRSKVLGIVPMMVEPKNRNRVNKIAKQWLQQTLPPDIEIFSEIKRTSSFPDATKDRLPISVFAEKKSNAGAAAIQFLKLTEELNARINKEESTKRT